MARGELTPFRCSGCGVAIAIVDADAVVCRSCSTRVEVPSTHRVALAALGTEGAAIARANAAWQRLARHVVPGWLDTAVNVAPSLIFWGGLATFAVLGLVSSGVDESLAERMGTLVFLPMELAIIVMTAAYAMGPPQHVVTRVATMFAAHASEQGPPECRACGAPLTVQGGETMVRCVYCRVDSLLGFAPATVAALQASAEEAGASADVAVTKLESAIAAAAKNARMMGLVNAVPVGVLCVWSFVPWLREYFVVNLLVIVALAFEGMVTGAGVVALVTRRAPDRHETSGALVAASMAFAPLLFFAGAGTSLGWIEASPVNAVLFGVIFGIPVLLFLLSALRSHRRASRSG
jgi:DNA-directed RNA polymerase subunit RPC12/RpoP